jgi:hypothetical protein
LQRLRAYSRIDLDDLNFVSFKPRKELGFGDQTKLAVDILELARSVACHNPYHHFLLTVVWQQQPGNLAGVY